MARVPKGVYQRPTADWFTALSSSGGTTVLGNGTDTFFGGLYNNATDGSYLYVYGISAGVSHPFSTVALYARGGGLDPADTVVQGGVPVILGSNMGPGQIIYGTYNSWFNFPQGMSWQPGDETSFPIFCDFPIAIIPPQWALLVVEQTVTGTMVVGFYWVTIRGENV